MFLMVSNVWLDSMKNFWLFLEINLCESSPLADELCFSDSQSGLSARCVDVSYRDLLPTQAKDMYLCICPPGMTGDGYGPAGCTG